MSTKKIIPDPPPPPTPKLIFFVELVTLAAIVYLIALTTKIDGQLENIQRGAAREMEGI